MDVNILYEYLCTKKRYEKKYKILLMFFSFLSIL